MPRKSRKSVRQLMAEAKEHKMKRVLRNPFQCPHCDRFTLRIQKKGNGYIASCSHCGLQFEFKNVPKIYEPVDIYGEIIDIYYREVLQNEQSG